MYLSHPVRRMRRDPHDATATLVVELDGSEGPAALREVVADAGGEVVEELPFDCWLVRLSEAGVDDVCALSGVVRVETEATLERSVDETVDPGEGAGDGSGPDREV